LFIQFSTTDIPSNNTWTIDIPNTQSSTYTTNNNTYQTALQTQSSSITAAQNAIAQAQAALDLKKSQARPAEVQAAQAQILTAQGQIQSAQAALENTITRAPFNGVISAVPIKFADLVTVGSNVVSIVSPKGLQVKIFVSNTDLLSVHPGEATKIGKGEVAGTVTNVSPSVSATSKTAEVDISIDEPSASGLTIGQNVLVVIVGKDNTATTSNTFLLPIQAVKITPDGHNYVYTLNDSSKAKQIEVTVGKVDGEHVEVTGGIDNNVNILSNAYGISEGDEAKVQ
jgi:RND family efflux transporter MFP subunit